MKYDTAHDNRQTSVITPSFSLVNILSPSKPSTSCYLRRSQTHVVTPTCLYTHPAICTFKRRLYVTQGVSEVSCTVIPDYYVGNVTRFAFAVFGESTGIYILQTTGRRVWKEVGIPKLCTLSPLSPSLLYSPHSTHFYSCLCFPVDETSPSSLNSQRLQSVERRRVSVCA